MREGSPVATSNGLSTSRLQIQVISDHNALAAAGPLWDRLVDQAAIDHPFLSHDWILSWWESFGKGKKLNILLVTDGDEVIGIAPLMISQESMYGVPVRELGFLYNDHTPRFDFIVTRDHAAVCEAVWRHLGDQHEEWDVLKLCQLVSSSPTLVELSRLATASERPVGTWPSTESPYLRIAGSFADYFASLHKGVRLNLKRRMKRLEEQGRVEFERVEAEEEIDSALAEAFQMEAATWKGSAGTAIACRPEFQKFYSLVAHRAARRGLLYLTFLRVGGKRIAFDLSLIYKKTLFKLKPGYLPEYHACSPGQQLTSMTVRDAFAQNLKEVDFLGAADQWKLSWSNGLRKNYWAFVFQNTMRGSLLHYAKFRVVPWLRRKPYYGRLRDQVTLLKSHLSGRGISAPMRPEADT